jgi:hypothetical protein
MPLESSATSILPNQGTVTIGTAARFPPRPPTPGCTLRVDSLLDAKRGKVGSAKGTFGAAKRSTGAALGGKTVCAEAFYSMPNALDVVQASRGVTVNEQRFRAAVFAGHESPGPIFFPAIPSDARSAYISSTSRFPASKASLTAHCDLGPALPSYSTKATACNFGQRTANNSPWQPPTALTHTCIENDEQHITGGAMSKAVRRSVHEELALNSEGLPGPGHFSVPSDLGCKGFHLGRKLRSSISLTPGPASYDLNLVAERMHRKRH